MQGHLLPTNSLGPLSLVYPHNSSDTEPSETLHSHNHNGHFARGSWSLTPDCFGSTADILMDCYGLTDNGTVQD